MSIDEIILKMKIKDIKNTCFWTPELGLCRHHPKHNPKFCVGVCNIKNCYCKKRLTTSQLVGRKA